MITIAVASLEFAEDDTLEVFADQVFVEQFTVVLMSPTEFEEFKQRYNNHSKDAPLIATYVIRLTKDQLHGAFRDIPAGNWFLAYTEGEAANIQLYQRPMKAIVKGGFG